MRKANLLALAAGIAILWAAPASAQEEGATAQPVPNAPPAPTAPVKPDGTLSRAIFGDALEKNKISLFGWAEASAIYSDNDSSDISPGAFFNSDDGLKLNQLGLTLCSDRACPPFSFGPGGAIHNRVGPFPGPKPENASIDFNVTAIYGEDVAFLKTLGFDGDFHFDRDDERKLGITQAFVDIYLPILDGTSVMIGSFQTPLENDIGYPFVPPNWFATHTYAFQHGPSKHVGVLAQSRLKTSPDFGLLAIDYGVVRGWNNASDRNQDVDVIGGIRWRSPDLKTWIDLEAIYGNGADDFGPAPGRGGSPYFVLSSTGEYLDRLGAFLAVNQALTPRFSMALEASYGRQEGGDIKFTPFAITENAQWYGATIGARYGLSDHVFLNGRAEWFKDEKGALVLWNGVRGDVYAFTGNLEWQPAPMLRFRAEARYDTHHGPGKLFDRFTDDDQFVGMLNMFVLF